MKVDPQTGSKIDPRWVCANPSCRADLSPLADWDCIIYSPQFCSVRCAEEYRSQRKRRDRDES